MQNYRIIERQQRDMLGEGLTWSPGRNAVFWVDILAPALFTYDLDSEEIRRWTMPEKISWIVERNARDDFVIGLKSSFATLNLHPFEIKKIGTPEKHRPHNRLNDAKVDNAGRLWAGSKDDRDQEALGALYRLDPDFTWSRHDDNYHITNGPTFSPDGRTLYHTDTLSRSVFAFDLTASGGLKNKRLFIRFENDWGYPDGMTTDVEGGIWIAHWGAGAVSRFNPDGTLDRSIAFPTSQITNCVFAGEKLDRMFVTSAAVDLTDEIYAGSLFEVDPGICGMAPNLFAG